MRARTLKKRERELRAKLLETATRLLSAAEKQAEEGRPHLLRTIVAVAHSTASHEATKKRLELAENQFEAKVQLEQIKLDRSADPDSPQTIDTSLKPPTETAGDRSPENTGDRDENSVA